MTIELDRISIGRPSLRVALADDIPADSSAIVVRRPTLRDAQRARSLLRAGTRDTANFSVALEVEVAIAPSAASARAAVAHIPDDIDGGTVRYVGTPSGLVTLIRDIYAAEVADAVILVSLDGSATRHRVRELVLPSFAELRAA
ncbi:hypothetical protein [Gordonia polyisoprenivorans]|uniref:hypothetical protein n=1 Tax=Gordonia polyisoprenivorans TaxID=84595 RepID=UPI000B99D62D|nr:hypothetical protein [Gordonia polyisoprenivorans]MBE7191783.1 hypothetical protein [Gordonia polyisoprenivorans]OZC32277.1 hypothetical protein CJJ17_12795 [Gordonia polyisoprenivorans]UZF55657.1 hypothetical protein LH935_23620 [Gordonia polyisoprenivorans]